MGGISESTRIVDLTFKLTGVEDELGIVKALTLGIQALAIAALVARGAVDALKVSTIGLGPAGLGILMVAGGVAAAMVLWQNQLTAVEEANYRGL